MYILFSSSEVTIIWKPYKRIKQLEAIIKVRGDEILGLQKLYENRAQALQRTESALADRNLEVMELKDRLRKYEG